MFLKAKYSQQFHPNLTQRQSGPQGGDDVQGRIFAGFHQCGAIGIVLCKSANRDYVEFVIRDYNKPMGVATYKSSEEMPENLRKALPDMEELKKVLNKQ